MRATGPGWPEWVRDRVRRSFLPSGGSWWDMTAALTDPTARGLCPVPPPFWAALVDAPTADAPTARATPVAGPAVAVEAPPPDAAGLRRVPAPSADAADPAPADASPRSVDVVFADLTDTGGGPVDGRLGMLAASMLRGGGILTVLTRCYHRVDGALADVTGEIVASAQNADLLYLQHIVIPTEPLRATRPTDTATVLPDLDRSRAHGVAHADLLVFARPRTGNIHSGPGTAAAGEATGCGPSGAVAAVVSSEARR